jgi:hypothetical protein
MFLTQKPARFENVEVDFLKLPTANPFTAFQEKCFDLSIVYSKNYRPRIILLALL